MTSYCLLGSAVFLSGWVCGMPHHLFENHLNITPNGNRKVHCKQAKCGGPNWSCWWVQVQCGANFCEDTFGGGVTTSAITKYCSLKSLWQYKGLLFVCFFVVVYDDSPLKCTNKHTNAWTLTYKTANYENCEIAIAICCDRMPGCEVRI